MTPPWQTVIWWPRPAPRPDLRWFRRSAHLSVSHLTLNSVKRMYPEDAYRIDAAGRAWPIKRERW